MFVLQGILQPGCLLPEKELQGMSPPAKDQQAVTAAVCAAWKKALHCFTTCIC